MQQRRKEAVRQIRKKTLQRSSVHDQRASPKEQCEEKEMGKKEEVCVVCRNKKTPS
jgi:hypothetical protein